MKLGLQDITNPIKLAIFRIVFGVFCLIESIYFFQTNLIQDYILGPKFRFQYSLFQFEPFSETTLTMILVVMVIASLGIITGFLYKLSTTLYFLTFSYIFLLEKTYYNNHLYLIALIALIMIFLPANNALSIRKEKVKSTKNWHIYLLQFQIILVYFFGGISKLNVDWLNYHEPVTSMLAANNISSDIAINFILYGGIIFDVFIGFLLIYKRTSFIAIIIALLFNITNHLMFNDINIFPFFMMASLILFLDFDRWYPKKNYNKEESNTKVEVLKPITKVALTIFVFIQLFMPLRHYFITDEVDWSGEGQRFAWRMKIQTRNIIKSEFAIFDLDKKIIYPVKNSHYIHKIQEQQMMHSPKMILDFAHFLSENAKNKHKLKNVMVKAKVVVDFNGHKNASIVSSDLDLSAITWNHLGGNEWIEPLIRN